MLKSVGKTTPSLWFDAATCRHLNVYAPRRANRRGGFFLCPSTSINRQESSIESVVEDIFENTFGFQTGSSDIEMHCNYPDENPDSTMSDIVNVLSHIGVMDNLKRKTTILSQ